MPDHPKVFISYSWKNEDYKALVLRLAAKLRGDGVDVILDRWHLRHGHDTFAFMETSIREADKVLVLCEETYVKKANSREKGAGVEARIISPSLYPDSRQEKVIPVFMEKAEIVPDFLKGRMGIRFQKQSEPEYEELLRVVYNRPAVVPPPLGSMPSWLENRAAAPKTDEEPLRVVKEPVKNEEPLPPIPQVKEEAPKIAVPRREYPTPSPVEDFEYEASSEGITITKYKGKGGAVVIPSEIDGKPVVKISGIGSDGAFENCKSLTTVTIPDSVTSIGNWAFSRCFRLTTVTIPDSVHSIGAYAFSRCTSLTSVTIPDSVHSIGAFAFSLCTGLTTVTIPDGVHSIGDFAFSHCTGLTSVTILDSNPSIANNPFSRCSSLQEIRVAKSNPAFAVRDGVLYSRDMKTLLAYPVGKTEKTFTVPDSVTIIGGWAFCWCTGLTSITIPDSVTSIGYWAFHDCNLLKSVTYSGSRRQWDAIEIKDYNTPLQKAEKHFMKKSLTDLF